MKCIEKYISLILCWRNRAKFCSPWKGIQSRDIINVEREFGLDLLKPLSLFLISYWLSWSIALVCT